MRFFDPFAKEELDRICQRALDVLSTVGCIVEHPGAWEQLQGAGARMDAARHRILFPEALVETALAATPRGYTAAGRDADAGGYAVHAGMESRLRCLGGALRWFSPTRRENRPITLADARKMVRLADALPQIDLVGTPYSADLPAATYDIHSLRHTLSGTRKHIWCLTIGSRNLRYQMELLNAVGGGSRAGREAKRISGIVCIIDPLKFPADEIERLAIYGANGVPVKWTSSSMIGGNAPYTVAGALVQNLAQCLAALVITHLLRPGTPVVYYVTCQIMDMRSGMAVYNSPELLLARAGVAQLARRYELPCALTTVTATGTDLSQAAALRSLDLLNAVQVGAGEINLAGQLDGGAFFCPEMAVLDDEIMAYLRRFRAGVAVDDDSMGIEAIARGALSGEYLSDPHTYDHLRTEVHFSPGLFDWRDYESRAAVDSRTLVDMAHEKMNALLAAHEVPRLDDVLETELDRIVAAADAELA